jgi:hypothetical protein
MTTAISKSVASDVGDRVDALQWDELAGRLDDGCFRSTIDMARHRFGDGRYRYFDAAARPVRRGRRR